MRAGSTWTVEVTWQVASGYAGATVPIEGIASADNSSQQTRVVPTTVLQYGCLPVIR